eukprot:Opistho-2@25061
MFGLVGAAARLAVRAVSAVSVPSASVAIQSASRSVFSGGLFGWAARPIAPSMESAFGPAGQVRCFTFGREYQPHTRRRKMKFGFLSRMKTHTGRRILENRRKKGRKFLSH